MTSQLLIARLLGALKTAACRARVGAGAGLLALAALAAPAAAQPLPPPDPDDGQTFRTISLHDIRENVRQSFLTDPEATAIDQTTLASLFSWMHTAGYQPVSLQQIIDARNGGAPLPPRAVLLTFDDGYASLYTKAFPLLKRFNYPAVAALVTSWMETPAGQPIPGYANNRKVLRENFLTWEQAREMADSGLVEFASHSHAMHQGIQGNPQGNLQPAAATRQYDPASGQYETVQAYTRRIETDMRRSRELIERKTGTRVRAMVWPYGAYTDISLEAAERAGMPITVTLEDGPNTPSQVSLRTIRRGLATYDMTMPDYRLFRAPVGDGTIYPLNRAMHIDLDYVYDPDPVQQERNLSVLLERVLAVGPRSVFLQAFADPDGDGAADAMYFPNRHLPMRADLFNRVAWQLRTRTGVQVYAWMPVMAFQLPAGHPLAQRKVAWRGGGHVAPHPAEQTDTRYDRLTPFDPEVRRVIGEIYEDLGRNATFAGLLFHDDALLGDDEDVSPAALATYASWGLPRDIGQIGADPALMARWTQAKTRYLTDFTLELADRVRRWRPTIVTARNLYARPVMQPESEAWFAQNYAQSLQAYDYTAVMAMPYMEQAADPKAWLQRLARQVAATPGGFEKTIFELQARDWRDGTAIADETLAAQWAMLHRMGARHFAYYPDDFHNDQPGLETLRRALSIRSTVQQMNDGLDTPPSLTEPLPPSPSMLLEDSKALPGLPAGTITR